MKKIALIALPFLMTHSLANALEIQCKNGAILLNLEDSAQSSSMIVTTPSHGGPSSKRNSIPIQSLQIDGNTYTVVAGLGSFIYTLQFQPQPPGVKFLSLLSASLETLGATSEEVCMVTETTGIAGGI